MRKRNWLIAGSVLLAYSAMPAMAVELDEEYVASFLGICHESPNNNDTFGLVIDENGETTVYKCEDVIDRAPRANIEGNFSVATGAACTGCTGGTGSRTITISLTRDTGSGLVWMCNYTETNYDATSLSPASLGKASGRNVATNGTLSITIVGTVSADAPFSAHFSLSDTQTSGSSIKQRVQGDC